MRSNLLYRRNPLAYPAGVAPGFDPTHPASKGIGIGHGLSVANLNGTFIDLFRGKNMPANVLTDRTPSIHSIIGPAITVTGNNGIATSSGNTTQADPEATVAAVIVYKVTAAGNQTIFSPAGAISTNVEFYLTASDGSPGVYGTAAVASTIPLTDGHPYFIAASASTAAGIASFVVLDLSTGSLRWQTVSGTAGSGVTTGEYWVGSDGFGGLGKFPIASVMYAAAFMSLSQLMQWAADPWAFWYPRQTELLVAASAARYAAFSIPQRDGLTNTQMVGY